MLAHFTALKRWTLSAVIRLQILCAMFLIVSFSSTARAEDGLSPFSAYELRLSQDTVLQTIAEAKLRLATAEFLPKVNVGGDWVVDGNIRYSPDITAASPGSYSKKDPSLMGVEVSWKLFDGFQNINNRAAAEEGLSYAVQASLDTRQKLFLERAERILGIVRDRALLKAYEDAVRRRRQALDISRTMLNEGSMTVSQVEIAGADLQNALATRLQAANAVKISELDYVKFTGVPLVANPRLEIPGKRLPATAKEAADLALTQSPQLKMALHSEQEAEYRARAAAGKYMPTVNLVGRYARTFDPSPQVNRVDTTAVLVRASMPIFDPTIEPARDLARAEALQRRYDRQDASLSLATEARRQHQLFHALSAQLSTLKKQISLAKAGADAVRIEIGTGERTITELLDAQESLLSASVNDAEVRYARDVAAFRLLATIGDLNENDVGLNGRQF
ncbi:TolC family protein [Rhizobium sp. NFR03]|uniref:TolC family protein n=1 Tax=Rhizobium sp. NFR03 TaxID=1566263 RepID=UPI0008BF7909|nr:TolC family protein [Rhizobium sp. NFR03]SES25807.1 Outer membrane protein TolC [Rhizobium sp. NFR03]